MSQNSSNHLYENERFDSIRKTLLDQYHSGILTHAGYIIALIVGALTLISKWDIFFSNGVWVQYAFFLIISFIVSAGFFFTSRLFYWSYLNSGVLSLTQSDFEKYDEQHSTDGRSCLCHLQDCIIANLRDASYDGNNRIELFLGRPESPRLALSGILAVILAFIFYVILLH